MFSDTSTELHLALEYFESKIQEETAISQELLGVFKKSKAQERAERAKWYISQTFNVIKYTLEDDFSNGKKLAKREGKDDWAFSVLSSGEISDLYLLINNLGKAYTKASNVQEFDFANKCALVNFYSKIVGTDCRIIEPAHMVQLEDSIYYNHIWDLWEDPKPKEVYFTFGDHDKLMSSIKDRKEHIGRLRTEGYAKYKKELKGMKN